MSKRPSLPITEPAAKRFLANPDAQGVLLQIMAKDQMKANMKITQLKEEAAYLKKQVEHLDKYTDELEGRMAALECVVSNMANSGHHHIVEDVINNVRALREYDMTDLDRIMDELATDEEEETNWFDELFE